MNFLEAVEEYCTPTEIPVVSRIIEQRLIEIQQAEKNFWNSLTQLNTDEYITLQSNLLPLLRKRHENRKMEVMSMLTE